jgi:hypothetical protein
MVAFKLGLGSKVDIHHYIGIVNSVLKQQQVIIIDSLLLMIAK